MKMKSKGSPVRRTVANFFRTTTLHGFKYLCSKYYLDRVGWVVCCVASSCCAGLLCAVLWARFLQVPALLQLVDTPATDDVTQLLPHIALCPPIPTNHYFTHLGANASMSARLSRTVAHLISEKPGAGDQLLALEEFLDSHNVTLSEVLTKNTPPCGALAIKCRWQKAMVPCDRLFREELITNMGICCVMDPESAYKRLQESMRPSAYLQQNRLLDFSLQCTNDSKNSLDGCLFFAKYYSETNVKTISLVPGFVYFAQLKLKSVPKSTTDEFVQSDCISDLTYSEEICLDKCAEKLCGCTHPLRKIDFNEVNIQLPCNITQMACLKSYGSQDKSICKCLPSCDTITSDLSLDLSPLDLKLFTLDPLYDGLNEMSTVLHIKLNIALSRMFKLNPTETWFTLLSSLGGVFNMFLGVGLFSALELLFFLIIKLPAAFIKSLDN